MLLDAGQDDFLDGLHDNRVKWSPCPPTTPIVSLERSNFQQIGSIREVIRVFANLIISDPYTHAHDSPSHPSFRDRTHLQMMPSFDYGAIACVSELLFNRTHFVNGNDTLDMRYYESLANVRFNKATNQQSMQELCQNPYEYNWDEI
ncbi:hypothetical protein KIN20_025119 [Parelaphostrongylus tenuis]|uniref:Uncharacterized protein n=1 Tax=Parelaphostrongylus tenuis TaxID=148309 RepID=A0AAD5MZ36_PARTN|nr:hypothetical protein KIN20_025119 [Parelaphostrongylus tenuis]